MRVEVVRTTAIHVVVAQPDSIGVVLGCLEKPVDEPVVEAKVGRVDQSCSLVPVSSSGL